MIKRAEDQYKNEKMTGVYGQLRKCLRRLGDNGTAFGKWLSILPDGDYGSIISGSFHVIIEVSVPSSNMSLRYQTHLMSLNPRPQLKCPKSANASSML